MYSSKDIYKYITCKSKPRENVGLLLTGAGDLVTRKLRYLCLLVRPAFRNLMLSNLWESLEQEEEDEVKKHLIKKNRHIKFHGALWDVSMPPDSASWCHWDYSQLSVKDYGDQEKFSTVEKSECHSCLQVGHKELQAHHCNLCSLEGDGGAPPNNWRICLF